MENSLSSSIVRVRLTVLRVGFKFRLAVARVRLPAPSRLLLALLAGFGTHALASPTGGQVVSGGVTITAPTPTTVDVTQTTNKGIVNWQSFNVASGEKVDFLQPGPGASTLNRIVGNDASTIFGEIDANGQVFLVNPSGILFAPGARVDVGGLVASTLQLHDADYLAGRYALAGGSGHVDNQGDIQAGFAVLAGAQVANTGRIVADGGTAALAAGGRMTLNLTGSDVVSVSVDAPTVDALVHAGGIVRADGGQVLVTARAAKALLGTVINVDGIVQARSVGRRDGIVVLDGGSAGVVSVTGTLDASGRAAGETGGTVKVLGADVGLFGNGLVDVSGDAGGGVARVGGDWHGAGADGDANASQAIVAGDSRIDADAITRGQGGDVVVWSQDRTQVTSDISARGGRDGGDGGAIETSSHQSVQATGAIDLAAPRGHGGTWLLDPNDITITNASSNTNADASFTSTNDGAIVSAGLVSAALLSGANVTITTASAGTNAQAGDITVDAAIVANSLRPGQAAGLTLNAQRNIDFTSAGAIAAGAGSLSVNLNAGVGDGGTGVAGTNPGAVTMAPGAFINTGAQGSLAVASQGAVQLGTLTVGGNLAVASGGGVVTQVGDISVAGTAVIDAGAGNITLDDAANEFLGAVGLTGGTVTLAGANALGVQLDAGDAILSAAGALTVAGTTSGALVASGASIDFGAATTTVGGALTASSSAGSIAQSGAVTVQGATTLTSGANAIQLTGNGNIFRGPVTLSGADVTLADGAPLTVHLVDVGSATLSSGGVLTADGSTSGALSLGGDGVTFGATSVGGELSVSSAGPIAQSAPLSVNGTSSFDAGSGTVSLGDSGNQFGGTVGATGGSISLGAAGDLAPVVTLTNTGGALSLAAGGALDMQSTPITAGPVNLQSGTAFSTKAAINAGTVTITASGVTLAHDVTASALLAINSAGDVSQSTGTRVESDGTTFLHAVGHDITLANDGDVFGGLVTATGNSVTLASAGALQANVTAAADATLAAHAGALTVEGTVGGDLGITGNSLVFGPGTTTVTGLLDAGSTNGSITQSGDLIVKGAGTSTLSAGTDVLKLDRPGNVFTGELLATAGTLTLVTSGALTPNFQMTSDAGDLTLSAGTLTLLPGPISTSGNVSLTSTSGLSLAGTVSGHDVTLAGGAVAIDDDVSASGTLTIHATGAVTQSGKLAVTGTSAMDAGTSDITLANAANTFGGLVTVTGGSISLDATGALSVAPTLGAGGDLALVSTGTLTLPSTPVATTGDITLETPVALTIAGALHGGNLALSGAAIDIEGGLAASDGLVLHATGPVTQRGAVTVGGATTVDAGTNAVTLDNPANGFGGPVAVSAGALALTTSGPLTLTGNVGGDASLTGTSVTFGAGETTVGGALIANSGNGAIAQDPASTLVVGGATTLNAGSGPITLLNATDGFGGDVTLTGGAVTLADPDALVAHVAASSNVALSSAGLLTVDGTVGGTMTLNGQDVVFGAAGTQVHGGLDATTSAQAGEGTITQAGALAVGGPSVLNAGPSDITLATAANAFGGLLTATGGAIDLRATGALAVDLLASTSATLAATGALAVQGKSTGDLSATANGIVASGPVSVGGALVANSGTGPIAQASGADVSVAGTSALDAGAQDISLGNAGNAFAGAVTANGAGITLANQGPLAATITASTGATLSASGALSVDGTSGGGLTLAASSVDFGAAGVTVAGNLTVATSGSPVAAAQRVGARPSDTGTGAITQSGTLSVGGTSALSSGAGDIALDGTGNTFTGAVTATGGAVRLADTGALTATVEATGDTTLASQGALSAQGGFGSALTLTGSSVLLGQGASTHTTSVGGALNAKATGGDLTLGFVDAAGATLAASGNVLLDGTLGSTTAVSLTGASIRGLDSQGALNVAGNAAITLTATAGDIGRTPGTPANQADPVGLIRLLGTTGQQGGAINLNFPAGQNAWLGIPSKSALAQLRFVERDTLNTQTFGCDGASSCFNVLGNTTLVADSVITGILSVASQEAADAAFGTDNLDAAVRKGFVTTIGRVPPGIDRIADELGADGCELRVAGPTSIKTGEPCAAHGADHGAK